jgi:hypothetical protein
LYALGLALGLSTINPDNPESAKASGIFTGIWGLVVPLIALFIGGAIASRGAGVLSRGGGALHGLVMWGLTTILGAYLIGNLLASVLSGVTNLGVGAAKAGGSAIGQRAQEFGLNADDALKPINDRLQSEGKPPISADQLNAATKDVLSTSVRRGKLDRETLINSITKETSLSRQDSEEIAGRIETQFNDATQKVQTGALQAADTTGKAFWGVFGSMLLGLIAAVVGGIVGVSRRQKEWAETPVAVEPPPFPQQPLHQ